MRKTNQADGVFSSQKTPDPGGDRSGPRRSTRQLLALVSVAGLALLTGWWLGRQDPSPAPPKPDPSASVRGTPRAAASTSRHVSDGAVETDDVVMLVDAGALRLLPDASLRFEPLEPPAIVP